MEDLKDLVIQTLDANGILDKIRAQLRSNVFKAIESQDNKMPMPQETTDVDEIMTSEDGQIAVELIRDFLEFHKLDYTLNVFLPECKLPQESRDKSYLSEKLGVKVDTRNSFLSSMVNSRKEKENKGRAAPAKDPKDLKLAPIKQTPQLKLPPVNEQPVALKKASPEKSSKKSSPVKDTYSDDFYDEIDEEIEEDFDLPQDSAGQWADSGGASSMGVDASVNSLTLEGYDHVESVSKIK